MDDLQSEKEQLEELRAWWSMYGMVVIAGIVITVAGLVGYNYYQDKQAENEVHASDLFESLAEHVIAGDLDSAESVADEIGNDYSNTVYAAQSKLALARLYMDKNRDQDAADVLTELIDSKSDEGLRNIARLRLAHILLYQDKPQEAIDLLEDNEANAFTPLYDEALGDAYTALEEYAKARDAYARAMADPSSTPVVNRGLVQMKLADLPALAVADAAPEEQDEPAEQPATPPEPGGAMDEEEMPAAADQPDAVPVPDSADDPVAEDGVSE